MCQTAVEFIRQFKVNYAMIGASDIDPQGTLFDLDYRELQVARAIIENAREIYFRIRCYKVSAHHPGAHQPSAQHRCVRHGRIPPTEVTEICRSNDVRVIEVGLRQRGLNGFSEFVVLAFALSLDLRF
jgi:DeoR family glycerol-3-phosphate regulon repressor